MSLNDTPSGERVHIGFFGVRNAGKSSLVNAVTGQNLAVVSDTPGTTTDVVRKAMELLPLGPVVILDTPGIDDEGALGELRVQRAREALRRCDVAVLVADATRALTQADRDLLALFEERRIPYLVARTKADLLGEGAGAPVRGEADGDAGADSPTDREVLVSAQAGAGIHELKERLARLAKDRAAEKRVVADLIQTEDVVVLVVPIDESAPKGRIILPQQLVLRDVLDAHASALVCQLEELARALASLTAPPRLVITDSQVFAEVAAIVPETVPLTSFSILMARYKGELAPYLDGAAALSRLRDGDEVLIAEGCTHHRQCRDIGTVKMPEWIRAYAGVEPRFSFTSGGEFPDDLSRFALVVHCGGCMLNAKEMAHRVGACEAAGVPIVNYGMAIAHMNGILARSLAPLGLGIE